MRFLVAAAVVAVAPLAYLPRSTADAEAEGKRPRVHFSLADYLPRADGKSDASDAFRKLFADVKAAGGGTVVIPPGEYAMAGKEPIPVCGNVHVQAQGARFRLPQTLGHQARIVLFQGENLRDFSWTGGAFFGHCFDPHAERNSWEPSANTRIFLITTSPGGTTRDILFRDIRSDGIAGGVVNVFGAAKANSESEVETYAENVVVENCTLLSSGKFMWDYGFLWQILVWPEDYGKREHEFVEKYFPHELIRRNIRMDDGSDRVELAPNTARIAVSNSSAPSQAICFFGDELPANIVRGKQYFVVESHADHIKIAETPKGMPIRFRGSAGQQAKMVVDLFRAFMLLYSPLGAGPGKGGIDIVACKHVRVAGCRLSARGDTMHIQRSHNVVFANNQILGSRMGAFFLAEYCKNATIVGNTVDGTNGSRVMSVEKSCEDVTIVGNTFRNGGRGSWINQPKNLVLQGNVFVNNTTKCERNPQRGRRSFFTGDYESYAEVYFTQHEPNGKYGPVIVRDNIFRTGPECGPAITFAPGGSKLLVSDNIIEGNGREIRIDAECTDVRIRDNLGAKQAP
jgi:hypothetical protein